MTRRKASRKTWIVTMALGLVVMTACGQDPGGTATSPEAVTHVDRWMVLHRAYLERAKKKDVGLLFLGDSITEGWNENAVWKRNYGPRDAANFGIGGDRTQHVLWRIDHGEVDGLAPRVVVLLIGTNNLGSNTPDEVVAGVRAIVAKLRRKLPRSKVLVLGLLPRGKDLTRDYQLKHEAAEVDPRVARVNDGIARLADGKDVRYLDLGKAFLKADGTIPKALMPDFVHLSAEGYRAWADAMEPTLWGMME